MQVNPARNLFAIWKFSYIFEFCLGISFHIHLAIKSKFTLLALMRFIFCLSMPMHQKKKEYIWSTSMEENFGQRKTNDYTLFNL